ncbi:MAG TPA: hypothetical protein VF440_06780 [Novosphingobium sp.]
MTRIRKCQNDRALRRVAIEHIIARYPAIDTADHDRLFDYFRNEARAKDRAAIRANPAIRPQYRQLCRDHSIDRLPLVNAIAGVILAFVLVLGVIVLLFGF